MKRMLRRICNRTWDYFFLNDVLWNIRHPFKFFYQTRFCSIIRVWWNFLWIRRDEFHPSLDFDTCAFIKMSKKDREMYLSKLVRRRRVAHERDFE